MTTDPVPPSGPPPGTIVINTTSPAHRTLAGQLPGWRVVPVEEAIARDVLGEARLCVADWRLFDLIGHLHEVLMQRRGHIVLVAGLCNEQIGGAGVAAMRRYAGEVLAVDDGGAATWRSSLQVPVTSVTRAGLAPLLVRLAKLPTTALDGVTTHLQEAQRYVERGDDAGAFSSAARALQLEPDQPGIIADVARLLARMGRSGEGEQLCRTFLLQRPDSAPVRAALAELVPANR